MSYRLYISLPRNLFWLSISILALSQNWNLKNSMINYNKPSCLLSNGVSAHYLLGIHEIWRMVVAISVVCSRSLWWVCSLRSFLLWGYNRLHQDGGITFKTNFWETQNIKAGIGQNQSKCLSPQKQVQSLWKSFRSKKHLTSALYLGGTWWPISPSLMFIKS